VHLVLLTGSHSSIPKMRTFLFSWLLARDRILVKARLALPYALAHFLTNQLKW
jgi:hypothetical protein